MPTRYTSYAEMAHLFKRIGLEFRIGTEVDCEDTLNFYIDDVTSTIDAYAGQLYSSADLNTSTWVRTRATWLACYRLSQIGGEPSLFYARYEEIMAELQKVLDNILPIPGLAASIDMVPSMSNIDHDPRYFKATRRVDPETSTPNTGGTRPREVSFNPWFSLW